MDAFVDRFSPVVEFFIYPISAVIPWWNQLSPGPSSASLSFHNRAKLKSRAPAPRCVSMASLNLSSNGPSITKSYQSVVNSTFATGAAAKSPTYGQWALFSVAAPLVSAFQQDSGKESVLKVQNTGGNLNIKGILFRELNSSIEGELLDLIDDFSDGKIQFAFVKVKDPNTTLPKSVLIAWVPTSIICRY